MKLSTKLTRAAIAVLVFGALSACLPGQGFSTAEASGCHHSNNNDVYYYVGGAVILGGAYYYYAEQQAHQNSGGGSSTSTMPATSTP